MYVIFGRWAWWYGGNFGMREMIDVFPILGLGMAALLQSVFHIQTIRAKQLAVGTALVAIFVFSGFGWLKVWQQKHWLVHYDGNTKASYWCAFLATEGIPGLDSLFVSPDYDGRLRTGKEHGTGY